MHDLLDFYGRLSLAVGLSTGASDSLLHVHAGLAIMFAARLFTKRSLASWTPFMIVLFFAIAKEVADRIAHGEWRMPDTIFDIINTIFWPLFLQLGLRWRKVRVRRIEIEMARRREARRLQRERA